MTRAESIFEMYCKHVLPVGPYGKTLDDVHRLIDKYAATDKKARLYMVFKELAHDKFASHGR